MAEAVGLHTEQRMGRARFPRRRRGEKTARTSTFRAVRKAPSGRLRRTKSRTRAGEGEISGLMYSCEHTSVSRLFLITEYKQNRCQKKDIFKIIIKIKTTFSYFS